MKICPEIYTEKITECTRFYCDYLGFRTKEELEGFVVLQHTENPEYEIMFCLPNSPFVDNLFHPEFEGKGLIFQISTTNIEAEYVRLQSLHAPIVLALVDEPINGKHFTIIDPNGILIDIAQLT